MVGPGTKRRKAGATIPYLYSDEQKQIRAEVRRVLASTCAPEALRGLLEHRGEHDQAFWQAARDMGWTAMAIAEADGGLELAVFDTLIVAEECGRALTGAPFLASGYAATHALAVAGNPDKALRRLPSGEYIPPTAFRSEKP